MHQGSSRALVIGQREVTARFGSIDTNESDKENGRALTNNGKLFERTRVRKKVLKD